MEDEKYTQKNNFKTVDEEREYWEARGPLAKGVKSKVTQATAKENRSSFLSVRLSGKELTQLRDLANKYDLGPSTFAQQVLVALMANAETLTNTKKPKTILFEDLFSQMMQKTTLPIREKLVNLFISSTKGQLDDADSIIIDKAKMQDWLEVSLTLISLLCETVNKDIKVVIPSDAISNKEKSNTPKDGELLTKC